MEFRQLQYFVAMYEEGSVTRAARRLNIVQPAISLQLAKLEDQLGCPLFLRTPKGLVPTQSGHEAYRLFLPILRAIDDARQELTASRDTVKGHVAAGVVASVAHNALSETLVSFTAKYADVTLRTTDGYTRELLEMLRIGQLDLVVINASRKRSDYEQTELVSEDLMLISGAKSQLPAGSVRLDTIDQRKLVIPSARHGLRMILEEVASQQGISLTPRFEFDEIGTIENFIISTDYVAILPPIAVANALRSRLLRCTPIFPQIARQIACVHHAARPLSRAATVFVDELRDRLVTVQRELRLLE